MAGNPSIKKREKERARQERQREKEQKRRARKTHPDTGDPLPDGTEPGIDAGAAGAVVAVVAGEAQAQ